MPLFRRTQRPPAARLTPADPGIEDTAEAVALEHAARNRHAARLVDAVLSTQAQMRADDRNTALVDLCLELRSALAPTPIGSRVLKELPLIPRGVRLSTGPLS
jgi:hypothetical protein